MRLARARTERAHDPDFMKLRPEQLEPDAVLDGLLARAVVDPENSAEYAGVGHTVRVRQRRAAIAVAFAVFLVVAALAAQASFSGTNGAASATAPKVAVKAEAVGIQVLRPGAEPQRIAAASPVSGGVEATQGAAASFSLEGIVDVAQVTTEAQVALGDRSARSSVEIGEISMLDGRVELTGAVLRATAASRDGRATGQLQLAEKSRLVVDGVARPVTANQQIAIEGLGTIIINEQAVVSSAPRGDAQTGPRHRVVGALAHLRVTTATQALPAGSEVIIGRVDAGVREGKVAEVKHPTASGANPAAPAPAPPGVPGLQTGTPAPGETALPRRPVAVRGNAPLAAASGSLQNYLFPVLGQHNYSNDWGAPRASTGIPHQGTDIFAAEGTPIVAVADGVLDRVGWNSIGGYRFWLFDDFGNSFYNAHLSAFSPIARDGARVKRGDVIGFVGHTGDARYTPPHLHFEIHPGNGAATNPFPFLNGWRAGVSVAIGLVTTAGESRTAPLSLLGFTDIAANSGLQESVLDTVPETKARPIEAENSPVPTDESLQGAIDGPGTSSR